MGQIFNLVKKKVLIPKFFYIVQKQKRHVKQDGSNSLNHLQVLDICIDLLKKTIKLMIFKMKKNGFIIFTLNFRMSRNLTNDIKLG